MPGLLAVAVVLAACGTGDQDLTFDEPTPTLFDDSSAPEPTEAPTTTRPAFALDQLAGTELPAPRSDAAGVVLVDGIAVPVERAAGDEVVVTTPCGASLTVAGAEIRRPLVVIDPAGDARITVHGAVVSELNHSVASVLQSELAAVGVDTIVTRPGDADVSASARAATASASGAVVVVSVAIAEGTGALSDEAPLEVVHPAADSASRRLAGLVHQSVAPVLAELPGSWTDDVVPGVRAVLNQRGSDFFTVLREVTAQGDAATQGGDDARVVVHLPTLTSDSVDRFRSPVTTVNLAQALAEAIARHLLTDDEGDGFVAPAEVTRNAPTASGDACVDPLAVEDAGNAG